MLSSFAGNYPAPIRDARGATICSLLSGGLLRNESPFALCPKRYVCMYIYVYIYYVYYMYIICIYAVTTSRYTDFLYTNWYFRLPPGRFSLARLAI